MTNTVVIYRDRRENNNGGPHRTFLSADHASNLWSTQRNFDRAISAIEVF